MRIRLGLLVVSLCLLTTITRAQPLADRVPGDAVFYVGWSGSSGLGAEYDASHLKAVLEATDMPRLVPQFFGQLFDAMAKEKPGTREKSDFVSAVARAMWTYPTAIYFAGVDFPDAGPPMPKTAVLCNAGADAPALVAKVKAILEEEAGESPVPVSISETAGLVQLTIGKAGDATAKLSDAAGFKAMLAKTHAKPVAIVYINGEALLQQVNTSMEKMGNSREAQQWPQLRKSLGLEGFKGLIWTAAFDEKNWSTRAFVAAPAPRAGVMKFLESQPLPDDVLKSVPETAILAGAGKLDLGAAFDAVRELAVSIEPRSARQIDRAIQQANQKVGLDIRQDVLGSIGDTWIYYIDPMTGGTGLLGGVTINRLRDPAKAEAAFVKLQKAFNDFTVKQFKREKVTIAFKQTKLNGQTVHYLAVPLVTPSWTIKNGQWIVGLYPQTVVAAARSLESGGKSLLDNPAYVELRKKLGDAPAVSAVQFADLPKLAPGAYSTWLLISRYAGFGDLFGLETPLMILPPMFTLQEHLSASGAISWSTDEGLFVRSISSFPGSTMISSDPLSAMGIAQPAVMASILLPSLNKARETANRVKCASNLRQIGMASILYANENKGKAAPDLGTLLLTQDMTVDAFMCPSSDHQPPANLRQMTREQQAEWINKSSDYVYLKPNQPLTKLGVFDILAHEREGAHDHEGMNVLFGDSHVEFLHQHQADEQIEAYKKKNEGGM